MTLCNTKNDINYWENTELQPLQESQLSYWFTSDFDTDTILRNKSPYTAGDGNIVNATRQLVHPSGLFGSCLSFNGNGYVSLPQAMLYNQLRFTISSSFKTTSTNPSISLYYEGSSISAQPVIFLDLNHNGLTGEVRFGVRDDNGVIGSASSTSVNALDGKWHTITGVSTLNSRNLYYDGVLIASNTLLLTYATTNTSTIGVGRKLTYFDYFTGLIGETIVSTDSYIDAQVRYNYDHSIFNYINKSIN